jgi:hypothetical protein
MLPSIFRRAVDDTPSSSSTVRQLHSDLRTLSKSGIRFTRAHPTRKAIRSGKITASSSASEISTLIHQTPLLRGSKSSLLIKTERHHQQNQLNPAKVDGSLFHVRRQKSGQKRSRLKQAKALGSYRVANYRDNIQQSRSLGSKMQRRRRKLKRERQQKIDQEPSLGSSRSFSSIWTIHALLAASDRQDLGISGSPMAIADRRYQNSSSTVLRANLDSLQNIPAEFLRVERMLRLQKEMAKTECHTISMETFDEMDVSLMMLPADFLFKHKFEKYAQERSFDNVIRVMEKLVSNAMTQAWSIWCTFVDKARRDESFARVNAFKKQKGTEVLSKIGRKIMLGSLYRSLSKWRATTQSMKKEERKVAACTIQRHWRAKCCVQIMRRMRKKIARVTMNILFLEWQERRWKSQHAAEAAQYRKEHHAAIILAGALRRVVANREMQAKRMERAQEEMKRSMALRVQCAWRRRQGRFSLFLKQRAREALEEERLYAACDIERVYRGYLGRRIYKEKAKQKEDENKAKRCLRRLLMRRQAAAFDTWSETARRQASIKRMMKRSLGGKLSKAFFTWSDNVIAMVDARGDEENERRRRAKERMIREEQEKLENEQKIKAALRKMFSRLLTGAFNSWSAYADQRVRARRLARRILGNIVESRFEQWSDWTKETIEQRNTMGRLAWEEEQRRLAEEAARAAAEEKERTRKLRWAVAKMNQRLISACYLAMREYAVQMLGVKRMLRKVMQGTKRQLYDRWWNVILDRREQAKTGNAFLRRLMNRKMYSAFKTWYDNWRTACRIRSKWAKKLVGKKRYFFERWYEQGLKGQGQRELNTLLAVLAERGRFIGLSKAMISVVNEILNSGIEELTWDDLKVLRRARERVLNFQGIEEKAALRVQSRWRCRKGQLAYQLIKQGKRMKQDRELRAVMMLSRVIRGRLGRRASMQMKEQRMKEKMKAKYQRERRQEKEREQWLLETEENEFRETLIQKRKMELQLEAARMRNELAKNEAEEQKWRNRQAEEERKQLELSKAKERSDHVAAFGGWVETKDIRSGEPYYYNELTGASQWEKPTELGGAGAGDADSVAAWIELEHGTGETYYYNTVTGQSSWDDPRKKLMRAPKIERRRCMGKTKKCYDKKTKKNAIAVRECIRCREDYCMNCFVEAHKSKKKNDHRFKPIVERKTMSLNCRDCTAMASRWCKNCDVNYCDNCYAWAHQGGSSALHECQMFVPGSQVCAECDKRVAIKTCHQCGDPFCGNCYDLQHRSGTKKRHTFDTIEVMKEVLKDAEEYCSVCNVRAADRACDPCGDPFCARCFKETHKTENKKGHSWTPWSRIRTGRDWVKINDDVSGQILYFNVKTRKTQTHKPTGLMSGMERDIEKKRMLAEKEMSARLNKERELLKLRQETTMLSREMKTTKIQLEEAEKVHLPKRKSFFGEIFKNPKKIMKSSILRYEIKEENTAKEKEFLRSRLITKDRDDEIAAETKVFGSDRHADTVVDSLIGKLKT